MKSSLTSAGGNWMTSGSNHTGPGLLSLLPTRSWMSSPSFTTILRLTAWRKPPLGRPVAGSKLTMVLSWFRSTSQ